MQVAKLGGEGGMEMPPPERAGTPAPGTPQAWAGRPELPCVDAERAGIVIISNRGPRDFEWKDGEWVTRTASGGLVSMLEPLARRPDVAWFCCVSEPPDAHWAQQGLFTTAADQTEARLHVVPVPVPADIYHAYYGQISNEVLWMLQHHVVGHGGYENLDAARHRAWERGYLEANRRLAAAITGKCSAVAAFLVQDYHLYPLPPLLRAAFPNTPILHFTHIPFPPAPLLKLLPRAWRDTILQGLLGADVIGMQTLQDVRSFLRCCSELLGCAVDYTQTTVTTDAGRTVAVRSYPASVDPQALAAVMGTEAVATARQRLGLPGERQTIIRVDRLDPSKNQLIGFQAFGRLLELHPELRRRVQFLAFLVPSRTDLSIYRAYRDTIYAEIEAINARFAADCGGPPIVVYYTNDREQALAAMEWCDVLLINSLQDGMNLVAKEWAMISRRPGVLVLSETTGVAAEAEDAALLVSPLDIEGTAQAMATALQMPPDQRATLLERFRDRIQRWTAADWLNTQLADLGVKPLHTRTTG